MYTAWSAENPAVCAPSAWRRPEEKRRERLPAAGQKLVCLVCVFFEKFGKKELTSVEESGIVSKLSGTRRSGRRQGRKNFARSEKSA